MVLARLSVLAQTARVFCFQPVDMAVSCSFVLCPCALLLKPCRLSLTRRCTYNMFTQVQKDIILHDNDADLVLLNPDWDWLLEALKARLPGFRVFFVVPSEDSSIRWIRVMSGVGIMDLVRFFKKIMGRRGLEGRVQRPRGLGDCGISWGQQHVQTLVGPADRLAGPAAAPGVLCGFIAHCMAALLLEVVSACLRFWLDKQVGCA